jgi:hypothetical protein
MSIRSLPNLLHNTFPPLEASWREYEPQETKNPHDAAVTKDIHGLITKDSQGQVQGNPTLLPCFGLCCLMQ